MDQAEKACDAWPVGSPPPSERGTTSDGRRRTHDAQDAQVGQVGHAASPGTVMLTIPHFSIGSTRRTHRMGLTMFNKFQPHPTEAPQKPIEKSSIGRGTQERQMSPGQVPNLIPSATVAQWLSRGRASVRAVGAHLTGRRR